LVKKIFFKSKWTSIKKLNGWKHYEVLSIDNKKKEVELFAVCEKKIRIKIKVVELKNSIKWIEGWKPINKKK